MYLVDPLRDASRLAQFHTSVGELLDLPVERLREVVPGVSGWSALEQLFHVLLANELALRNVRLLIGGDSAWIQPQAAPSFLGHLILCWDYMPRGVGQSPRTVRPPAKPDLTIVRDTLSLGISTLTDLSGRLPDLARVPGGIPHHELGPLSAAQWLRFARLHGLHHLALAREVLAAGAA